MAPTLALNPSPILNLSQTMVRPYLLTYLLTLLLTYSLTHLLTYSEPIADDGAAFHSTGGGQQGAQAGPLRRAALTLPLALTLTLTLTLT
jgi:hypothetical protein